MSYAPEASRSLSSRGVVADTVLKAVTAAHPKLRYPAGGLASRLRLLRRFAPAALVDAGIRKARGERARGNHC